MGMETLLVILLVLLILGGGYYGHGIAGGRYGRNGLAVMDVVVAVVLIFLLVYLFRSL